MDIMIDSRHGPEGAGPFANRPARDEVTVATGASIVVLVAAMLAVVLAVLVASLGTAGAATRDSFVDPAPRSVAAPHGATGSDTATALAMLGVATAPARDGLYRLALPAPKSDNSLAVALVGGLFLAMTGAAGMAWRAVIGSALGGGRHRRPQPARRAPTVRTTRPLTDPFPGEPRSCR